jgi:3-deoxy-D-manno-octulosonic-acid transferase
VLAWTHDRAALAFARQAGLDLVAQSRGAADRYAQALLALVSQRPQHAGPDTQKA